MKDMIKEVALEVARKMRDDSGYTNIDLVCNSVEFATAFLAELSKRAEVERLKDCWSAEGAQVDALRQQNAELTAQINNLKAQIAHLEYQYRP